jgi:regulator of protease activity HflC (stomatin/prohibitin superfamily)
MRSPQMNAGTRSAIIKIFLVVVLVGVLMLLLWGLTGQFVYLFARVNPDEVGIKLRGGQIADVVPPGVYSDVGLFVDLLKYNTQAYQFSAADPEVITQDNQRIGVTVSGSVLRPTLTRATRDELISYWVQYRSVYTSDQALQKVAEDLSFQSMKVCVGDRPFNESILGTNRDELRNCIDDELNKLMVPYGLAVANVTVPNVTLSEEVKGLLDAITKSRLETEKARQDKLKAEAEGTARQAQQEAEIRVQQAAAQETARQQATLAKLEVERLNAEKARIEASKANDLLAAQKDLEINTALADAALERARADLANEFAKATLYSSNANYLYYQLALANASALTKNDKLIFLQPGMFPNLVFGGQPLPTFSVNGNPITSTETISGTLFTFPAATP